MEQYRPTTLYVDVDAVRRNLGVIKRAYPGYEHMVGVIKADCYGLGMPLVRTLVDAGCDYLCVSLPEEALAVRRYAPDVPVLIFVPAPEKSLPALQEMDIAVTVATLDQARRAVRVPGLKVFLRANGGHDLFGGPTTKSGFTELYRLIHNSPAQLEGIYLHNYHPEDEAETLAEYNAFEEMTAGIDLTQIPVVSASNSLTLPRYPRKPYSNACRIGNLIYGIENDSLGLETCFQLRTEVAQVVNLRQGDRIGYASSYTADTDGRVAVLPIGYGDGLAKANVGRDVFIHDRRYPIVAVTMDVTLIAVDQTVLSGDTVVVIRDPRHLDEIAAHTHGVAEEPVCLLTSRVPRRYVRGLPMYS